MSPSVRADRKALIQRELDCYDDSPNKRSYFLTFRGERISLPVIRVNPSHLFLNSKNSRIFVQVEGHAERAKVWEDPDSQGAQDLIIQLLRATPEYKSLKDELKTLGQEEPGIVTRDGTLINGNTRAAALLELGVDGIDVAVLPETATPDDLISVEMKLQMLQLTHQHYSFTNQLLMMRRYLDSGKSWQDLAKEMNWQKLAERRINQHMRWLDYIEELRELSDGRLGYEAFDNKKEHLKNLDDDYQGLLSDDREAAEDLKWTRLTALVLGVNKDQIRAMGEDFVSEEMKVRIDSPAMSSFMKRFAKEPEAVNDGLDDIIGVSNDLNCPFEMRAVAMEVLSSRDLSFPEGDMPLGFTGELAELKESMTDAADDLILKNKRQGRLENPVISLKMAREKLDDVIHQFEQVADEEDFKNGDFKYVLNKVDAQVKELVSMLAKVQ